MTLLELIVTEFIEYYLQRADVSGGTTKRRKRNGENVDTIQTKSSPNTRQICKEVLPSLLRLADDLGEFLYRYDEFGKRITELTEPLVPLLTGNGQNDNGQQFSKAFDSVADSLFEEGVTWERIVTLLVYCGELAVKVSMRSKRKERISTMISELIENVCRYFDENLLSWIDHRDGGWLDVIKHESEFMGANNNDQALYGDQSSVRKSTKTSSSSRCMRQVISVAAFAVVIGGLYMCSRLSVQ